MERPSGLPGHSGSIRAEHIRERDDPRTSLLGDPENSYSVLPSRADAAALCANTDPTCIGVGMQSQSRCYAAYNEDIAILFREVQVGSPGEFLYQPVKVGTRDRRFSSRFT